MQPQHFATEINRNQTFGYLVRQSVSARLYATEQFSLCSMKHTIPQRFARWLLIARDRVGADIFPFTHETLALILGVRRSGVTEAVHVLYEPGAIEQSRGKINVRDSVRLRAVACECYEKTTQVFEDALLARNALGDERGLAAEAKTRPERPARGRNR